CCFAPGKRIPRFNRGSIHRDRDLPASRAQFSSVARDESVEHHCEVLFQPLGERQKAFPGAFAPGIAVVEHTIELLPQNDCARVLEKGIDQDRTPFVWTQNEYLPSVCRFNVVEVKLSCLDTFRVRIDATCNGEPSTLRHGCCLQAESEL